MRPVYRVTYAPGLYLDSLGFEDLYEEYIDPTTEIPVDDQFAAAQKALKDNAELQKKAKGLADTLNKNFNDGFDNKYTLALRARAKALAETAIDARLLKLLGKKKPCGNNCKDGEKCVLSKTVISADLVKWEVDPISLDAVLDETVTEEEKKNKRRLKLVMTAKWELKAKFKLECKCVSDDDEF